MGTELDEDLIEATIRRVAEAKAAQAAASSEPAPESGPPDEGPDTDAPTAADASLREAEVDRVESMIRRVTASKAARVADEPSGSPAATPEPAASLPDEAVGPHEDLIEATIRRVAAAKTAQAAAEAGDPPAVESASGHEPEPEPAAAPPRPLHFAAPSPAWRPAIAPVGAAPDEPALSRTVSELRRELDATKHALEALTARVDALGAAPARLPAAPPSSDDGWDDAPSLPRIPNGQPIRPAIFRDPSPQTATAEHLEPQPEEVVLDTRPIPKPLPPLHAAPKRGFDLLPRTYRVTVEDKRRGVDLVPLHRALLGMDGVRDMSLLSYSNGTAIVSLDTLDELNPDALCEAISRAMSRDAKVEVHNEQTMVVKLAEE